MVKKSFFQILFFELLNKALYYIFFIADITEYQILIVYSGEQIGFELHETYRKHSGSFY
jgi:hypothetical protein